MKVAKVFTIITIVAFTYISLSLFLFGVAFSFPFFGSDGFESGVTELTNAKNFAVMLNASRACFIFIIIMIIMLIVLCKSDEDFFITEKFVASFIVIVLVCGAVGVIPAVQSCKIASADSYSSDDQQHEADLDKYMNFLPYYDSMKKYGNNMEIDIEQYKLKEFTYSDIHSVCEDEDDEYAIHVYRSQFFKSNSLLLNKLYKNATLSYHGYWNDDGTWITVEDYIEKQIDEVECKLYVYDEVYEVVVESATCRYECYLSLDDKQSDCDVDEFAETAIRQYKMLIQEAV